MAENTTNVVEKIEAQNAIANVQAADRKVAQLEAEKLAKKQARQDKRANWPGPLKFVGKLVNVCEDHPVATTVLVGLGGLAGVAGVFAYDALSNKDSDDDVEVEVETIVDNGNGNVEAPFDTTEA